MRTSTGTSSAGGSISRTNTTLTASGGRTRSGRRGGCKSTAAARTSTRAVRLCRGDQAFINRIDGDDMVRVASVMSDDEAPFPIGHRFPLRSAGIAQDAVREGRTIHRLRDADPRPGQPYLNYSSLSVPLSRETTVIGALAVTRGTRTTFSEREVSLLAAEIPDWDVRARWDLIRARRG